jgi:hypothetical protein
MPYTFKEHCDVYIRVKVSPRKFMVVRLNSQIDIVQSVNVENAFTAEVIQKPTDYMTATNCLIENTKIIAK